MLSDVLLISRDMFDTMNSPNRNMAIVNAVRKQGRRPSRVAQRFGSSRQRVYQILNVFDAGGANAIAPRSRAPHGVVRKSWTRSRAT